jgi:hypothetical protein
MICVIAVAIRKDVKDRSKREHLQSGNKTSRAKPVLETNKNNHQTPDQRASGK